MVTEKQKILIIKYQNKCEELDYKYIKYQNQRIYAKCNKCNINDDFQIGNFLRAKNSRCSNCIIIKYKNQCEELDYKYIDKFRENKKTWIKCKCNKCNLIDKFDCSSFMRNNIRCSLCLNIKYQSKCEELDYEFIEHFRKNKSTCIKARCYRCDVINDFYCNHLMNNSVNCECEKKPFVRGYIYGLTIGYYWYIGLTTITLENRYGGHKKSCFYNKEITKYNSKIYKNIREELCRITKKSIDSITKEDFIKYVLQEQLAVINTSYEDLKSLESKLINVNNHWCLNTAL